MKQYADLWLLEVNLNKSQVIIFNQTGRLLQSLPLWYGEKTLKVVKSYTYLGVEMTAGGTFHFARETLADKAGKAMFPLISTISQFHIPIKDSIRLFRSVIQPILLYNAENWATFSKQKLLSITSGKSTLYDSITNSEIERVHFKFLKFILGVNNSSTNAMVLGEVGAIPVTVNALFLMLKFWFRVMKKESSSFVNQAYRIQDEGFDWYNTVVYLLTILGLDRYRRHPNYFSEGDFRTECKTKLENLFKGLWENKLKMACRNNQSKLAFYAKFKTKFQPEPYLSMSSFCLRQKLAKFRCSNHRLRIETGRHNKTPKSERICMVCNKNEIETEEHFIRSCSLYDQIRERNIGVVNSFNWKTCLCPNTISDAYKLAKFLTSAELLREITLIANKNTILSI